uniref:Uncharacterized protein n=1 Tax=Anguilla anguilla TaxID=7936 RepID=A0A0E9WCN8_ANGAN
MQNRLNGSQWFYQMIFHCKDKGKMKQGQLASVM